MKILLFCAPAALAADRVIDQWPIKEFEVVSAKPWITAAGAFDRLVNLLVEQSGGELDQRMDASEPLNLELRDAMEAYLGRAARQLEAWGFPPPKLEPIVTRRDGKQAYRVFYADLGDDAGQYWSKRMGLDALRDRSVIILSGKPGSLSWPIEQHSTRGVTLSPFGKMVLGHELFHAVQFSMPFFQADKALIGDWITEGTADAVGEDLYRILETYSRPDPDPVWGFRSYAKPLVVHRLPRGGGATPNTYRTASLWRYIAELHARPRQGKPGPAEQSVDYGYLVALFKRWPPRSEENYELRWLDDGLRNEQRIGAKGLYRIFPDFVSTYAAYGEHRAAGRSNWREESFDGCVPLALSPDMPAMGALVSLAPVAARCIEVDASAFPQPVTFTVQVQAASELLAAQTTIGTAGGQRVAHEPAISKPFFGTIEARPWVATTVFLSRPGEVQPMILANVGNEPWTTLPQEVFVRVSTSGYVTNLKDPPRPGAGENTDDSLPAGTQGARQAASRDMRLAAMRVVQTGVTTTRLERQTWDDQNCRPRYRRLNLCGPQLEITMRQQPGSADMMTATMGSAGVMGQVLAGAGAMLHNLPEMVANSHRAMYESEYSEAGTIQLSMPLIDYGFTGRLTNVRMRVTRQGGGDYQAVGPRDIEPGNMTLFPPSAEVYIEEYSPTFMSGTFNASLIDPRSFPGDSIPLVARESMPVLPVAREIQGRFFITAPWRDDERTEASLIADPDASLQVDLSELLPTDPGGLPDGSRDQASQPASSTAASRGAAGADLTSSHGCDCSCEAFARYEAELDSMQASAERGVLPAKEMQEVVRCMMYCPGQWMACD